MERDNYLQIGRPSNECALCGRALAEIGRHPSVIDEPEEKTDRKSKDKARNKDKEKDKESDPTPRRDFCPECWSKAKDLKYFSFWLARRTRPAPNRKLAKAERNEVLWRLFSALTTRQEPETEPQRFLLAHLLMKYGVLRWQANSTDEEGLACIVFEHTPTGEPYRVREHAMDEAALVQTLQEIEALVAREVNPGLADAAKL